LLSGRYYRHPDRAICINGHNLTARKEISCPASGPVAVLVVRSMARRDRGRVGRHRAGHPRRPGRGPSSTGEKSNGYTSGLWLRG